MSFWTYILQSRSTGRYYCGHTDNLNRRLSQHNDPEYIGTRTTKILEGPWDVVWTAECADRGAAVKLERKIKKRGIGRYLHTQQVESRLRRD